MMIILKYARMNIILALVLILGTTALSGCTSYRKTTTTTTERASSSPDDGGDIVAVRVEDDDDERSPTVSTTEVTETKQRDHGLIGSIFYAVGEIIAFPFKLIGGVFDAIF